MITIEITYASNAAAQAAAISFANMKYNSKFALSLQKDDGGDGDYKVVFNYLNKGLGYNNATVEMPYVSDGCGNPVKLKSSFAVFSFDSLGNDLHNGSNPNLTTWTQYQEIVNARWSIMNHALGGVDRLYGDRGFQLKENDKYIYSKVGFRPRIVVVPSSDEGFTISAVNLGYKMITSNFGGDSPDGQTVLYGSQVRADTFHPLAPLLVTRTYLNDPINLQAAKGEIDNLFNHSDGNQTNMPGDYLRLMFSHNPGVSQTAYSEYIELIRYAINHPLNNGNLWVPSVDEFMDYYLTKDSVVKSESVVGSKRIIEINTDAIPVDVQFQDISIMSSSPFVSATVTGADSFSRNVNTGLINVFKYKGVFSNPALDTLPPRIIDAFIDPATPTILRLKYDKSVTQSIAAAYEVPGTTVTAISGSGTEWQLQLSSPIIQSGTQQRFNYRAQTGNATGPDGKKTTSYIGQYVDFKSAVPTPSPELIVKHGKFVIN